MKLSAQRAAFFLIESESIWKMRRPLKVNRVAAPANGDSPLGRMTDLPIEEEQTMTGWLNNKPQPIVLWNSRFLYYSL